MRDSELSADITRSHSLVSKFHDPLSDHVRKGPTVDEEAAELVDSAVAWNTNNHQAMIPETLLLRTQQFSLSL